MTQRLLLSLSLLGFLLTLSVRAYDTDPSPVPNQECGTTAPGPSPPANGDIISVLIPAGVSGDDAVQIYYDELAAASGAICYICPDGIQCPRSYDEAGSTIPAKVVGRIDNPDGSILVMIMFTGAPTISITCAEC